MGCFQPDDASAHTSYLIVLLKRGPGFLPGRPTIIQAGTDWSTGLEAFFRPPATPWRAKERRIIRTAKNPSTVFGLFSRKFSGWRKFAQKPSRRARSGCAWSHAYCARFHLES